MKGVFELKQETLNIIKSFYESSGSPVWILDENWKIVWGTCSYDNQKSIPELLDVPLDLWKQTEKKIFWNGNYFDCTLECSPECQSRILKLKPSTASVILPIDDSITANSAHILKMVTDQLEHAFHQKNIHDLDHYLCTLRSICYAIFRNSYIQRLLNHIYSQNEKELFSISSKLSEICENTESLLHNFAKIEFCIDDLDPEATKAKLNKITSSDLQKEFLSESETVFCAAILSGILLCCKEPEQEQSIRISLHHYYAREEIEILISVTARNQLRKDRTTQSLIQSYSDFKGEENLLELLCNSHRGIWKLSESKNHQQVITNHCSIILKSDHFTANQFRSRKQKKFNPSFFDVYHVLLARIFVPNTNFC